jgi:hypothetical protein
LIDHVEFSHASGEDIDKSLERLQAAGLLKRCGQSYYASGKAVEGCRLRISQQQPIRAAIGEVHLYLLEQGPVTADDWRRIRSVRARGARRLWRGPRRGAP